MASRKPNSYSRLRVLPTICYYFARYHAFFRLNKHSANREAALEEVLTDTSVAQDPFNKLPRELSDLIISLLDPLDVTSLRLASCALHLPLSDWQHILINDIPWLWELRDDAAPSFWATFSVSDIDTGIKRSMDSDDAVRRSQEAHLMDFGDHSPQTLATTNEYGTWFMWF